MGKNAKKHVKPSIFTHHNIIGSNKTIEKIYFTIAI